MSEPVPISEGDLGLLARCRQIAEADDSSDLLLEMVRLADRAIAERDAERDARIAAEADAQTCREKLGDEREARRQAEALANRYSYSAEDVKLLVGEAVGVELNLRADLLTLLKEVRAERDAALARAVPEGWEIQWRLYDGDTDPIPFLVRPSFPDSHPVQTEAHTAGPEEENDGE